MLTPRPLAGPTQAVRLSHKAPRKTRPALAPVSLSRVPVAIRRRYGRRLVEEAGDNLDLIMAAQLTRAIENPSDKIYWLPREAIRRVLG